MRDPLSRLDSLCVADVMARDVVSVSANQSMCSAALLYVERGISAAPVIDDSGRCVGILSATDFLRELTSDRARASTTNDADHRLVADCEFEAWRIDVEPGDVVASRMSPAVQSVAGNVPILMAARIMGAQHVHRLVVLDTGGHPVGMISTMDVVSALLNVLDEPNTFGGVVREDA